MNFICDENIPPALARSLKILGKPVDHVVDMADLGRGTTDARLIQYLGIWGYYLISLDTRITRNPHERALLMANGVGAFFIKGANAKRQDPWELVEIVIRRWREIEIEAVRTDRPFIYLVNRTGCHSL